MQWRSVTIGRCLNGVTLVVAGATTAIGAIRLMSVLTPIAAGWLSPDSPIYFVVGRGVLNGVELYSGLFESKPPGLFLLNAASLATTDGPVGAMALQIGLLAIVPLLAASWAATRSRHDAPLRRVTSAFLACSATFLIVEYLIGHSLGFQAESIGAPVVMLGGIVSLTRWRRRPLGMLLWGGAVLIAVATKESFLPVAIAGSLLLSKSLGEFVRRDLPVILGAILIGVLLLVLFDVWEGYTETYLPAMVGHRIGTQGVEPFLARPFAVARLLYSTTHNPPAPWLGWLIAAAWLGNPWARQGNRSARQGLVAATVVLTGYWVMVRTWIMLTVATAAGGWRITLADPYFVLQAGIVVALVLLLAAGLLWLHRRESCWPAASSLGALMLTSLAVGLADYRPTHFGIATPVYLLVLLPFLLKIAAPERHRVAVLASALCLLAVLLRADTAKGSVSRYLQGATRLSETARSSRELDELLTNCQSARYFVIGGPAEFALSKHSPVGPLFWSHDHQYLGMDHDLFRSTAENVRREAFLVIGEDRPDDAFLTEALTRFVDQTPRCAADSPLLNRFRVRFRVESS